jgi:hypothetical protein
MPRPNFTDPFDNDRENMKETKNIFSDKEKQKHSILNVIEEQINMYEIKSIDDSFGNIKNFYESTNFIISLEDKYDVIIYDVEAIIFNQLSFRDLENLFLVLKGDYSHLTQKLINYFIKNKNAFHNRKKLYRFLKLKRILNNEKNRTL